MAGVEGDSRAGARRWAPAAIVLAGALAHFDGLRGAFVYDDLHNIAENPYLGRLWPPGGWLWARPRFGLAGRPVASFSFAVNHALGGLDPWGYHALNLAIHLTAALLLYGLVRRSLELAGGLGAARAAPLALASALLWVVHPLTTAAVTYVYQRCESLMAALLLATLYAALVVRSEASNATRRRRAAALALAACYLGAGTKETMVVAPLLVLLFDRALVAGSARAALRAAPGLYAGLFGSWIAIAVLVVASGARSDSVGFGFAGIGPWEYLRAQGPGLVRYARLALWPDELVFDYGLPLSAEPGTWLPHGLCVLLALGVTAVGLWRNRPWALLGAAWFLVLAPSSSVLPIATEIWVEHRAYLPLAALIVAVVLVAAPALGARAARALLALAVMALGVRTHLRSGDYASEERLWRTTVAQVPENARAHYALGDALRVLGRREEALERFEEAVRLAPEDAFYRVNPGVLELELGRPAAACVHLEAAVRLRPEWSLAHQNLGEARLALGDLEGATAALERALQLEPGNLEAGRELGIARARAGRLGEARGTLEFVLRERPQDLEALVELGELLLAAPAPVGEPGLALELAERARALSADPRVIALLERARAASDGS